MGLPTKLSMSIESKLQMEQESQRMDFVLQKERQEAERKRIEAQGIADFQNIVSKGIDDKTLRWKGIEATMELAKSENAKVVVVLRKRRRAATHPGQQHFQVTSVFACWLPPTNVARSSVRLS